MSFETFQQTITSGAEFTQGPKARAFIGLSGRAKDEEFDLMREGLNVAFVHAAPDDALAHVARDSAWPAYPQETDVQIRERLEGRWDLHYWSGTQRGLKLALSHLGYDTVLVREDHEGTFATGENYSRFWVFVLPPLPCSSLTMPFALGQITLGSTASVEVVRRFVADVQQFKATHAYPVSVVHIFSGALLGINTVMGSFNLGDASVCNWQIGRLFGVNTSLPFTLGGYNLGD
jgi:hypothetical protein